MIQVIKNDYFDREPRENICPQAFNTATSNILICLLWSLIKYDEDLMLCEFVDNFGRRYFQNKIIKFRFIKLMSCKMLLLASVLLVGIAAAAPGILMSKILSVDFKFNKFLVSTYYSGISLCSNNITI